MSIIGEEELREVVEVVWMTALDLQLEEDGYVDTASANYILAQISITGEWQGVVSVQANEELLSHAASIMFSCPVDNVSDMDRKDALTELTNMLGGTVKCLLPEGCDLSLPLIRDEFDADSQQFEWVGFSCDAKPLAVAISEMTDDLQQVA